MNEEISNRELLDDIVTTEKEIAAYEMIANGYDLLATLPQYSASKVHANDARRIKKNCEVYLENARRLAADRGLI